MDLWNQIGPHRYQIRGDVLVWESHGPHSIEDTRGLLALTSQLRERYGYVISLINSKEAAPDAPGARKLITDWQRDNHCPTLNVMFGASWLVRVAITLLVRAARLINNMDANMRFVAKEEEGWAMIDQERELLRRIGDKSQPL